MANKTHPVRGYVYIAAATLLWGVAASLGRAAFTGTTAALWAGVAPIDPLILSQSRTTISFLVLLPVLAAGGVAGRTLKIAACGLRAHPAWGFWAWRLRTTSTISSIQKTNVATAIILQYTAPVLVLLYMVARGLQKATAQRVAAVGWRWWAARWRLA